MRGQVVLDLPVVSLEFWRKNSYSIYSIEVVVTQVSISEIIR